MKYWVIGVTAALTLLAANPLGQTRSSAPAGPAYASADSGETVSN